MIPTLLAVLLMTPLPPEVEDRPQFRWVKVESKWELWYYQTRRNRVPYGVLYKDGRFYDRDEWFLSEPPIPRPHMKRENAK